MTDERKHVQLRKNRNQKFFTYSKQYFRTILLKQKVGLQSLNYTKLFPFLSSTRNSLRSLAITIEVEGSGAMPHAPMARAQAAQRFKMSDAMSHAETALSIASGKRK